MDEERYEAEEEEEEQEEEEEVERQEERGIALYRKCTRRGMRLVCVLITCNTIKRRCKING